MAITGTVHRIQIEGMGETRPATILVPSRDAILANIDICNRQIDLIDEQIARQAIAWPQRLPRQRPVFEVTLRDAGTVEATVPTSDGGNQHVRRARGLWRGLHRYSMGATDARLTEQVQRLVAEATGRAGPIVVVGEGVLAESAAGIVRAAGREVLLLAPGYGPGGSWIVANLLRRPAANSFLGWLSERPGERIDGAGAIAFLARDSWSADFAMLDACADRLPPILVPDGASPRPSPTVVAPEQPRISIVTVSYNQAAYLEACLRSVLDQGYENLEYIVVDGGSTDGSVDIIERYRHRLNVVIIEPDDGQSDALNKGFARATGDIMNWLCSDDMLEPGALKAIAAAYRRHQPDLIVGGCVRIGERRQDELFRHHSALQFGGPTQLAFADMLNFMGSWQKAHYFFQPEVFFSRRIWEASGAYLKRHLYYAMDYDLWLRMALAGAVAYHVPAMLGCSRVHAAQKTQDDQRYLHQLRQIMEEYRALFEKVGQSSILGDSSGRPGLVPRQPGGSRMRLRLNTGIVARLRSVSNGVKTRLRQVEQQAVQAAGYGLATHLNLADFAERSLLLAGQSAARQLPRHGKLKHLSDAEFRVFSQWGEDGIVEWLVSHVAVPNTRFVEFGVETFREANCRFLLMHRNWKGLVLDGNASYMAALRAERLYWMYDLTATPAFVTRENIDELITAAGFAGPLGILSIDIDGNDYWVWDAIKSVDPAIVICEYNPILGDMRALVVPYDPHFTRFNAHHSGLYFGCSIAALRQLAAKRGYTFVGTNSNGINAFFVRDDLAGPVLAGIEAVRAYPSRHRDSRDEKGQLSFTGGLARFDLIRHLEVVDVSSRQRIRLDRIEKPYSDEWLDAMR